MSGEPLHPHVRVALKLLDAACEEMAAADMQPAHVIVAFGKVVARVFGHGMPRADVDPMLDQWLAVVKKEAAYHASGACELIDGRPH